MDGINRRVWLQVLLRLCHSAETKEERAWSIVNDHRAPYQQA